MGSLALACLAPLALFLSGCGDGDDAAPQATAAATPACTPSAERPTAWPIALAVNADTKGVYVANQYLDTISVIDEEANAIVTTVPVGVSPLDVAVNPDTGRLYVPKGVAEHLMVVDADAGAVAATIPIRTRPDRRCRQQRRRPDLRG